jgi:cell division protein FtsW (lipid II flippase)
MNEALPQRKGRTSERLFLLLIAIVFGVLFFTLFNAHQRSFQDVDKRLQDGTMVNLNDSHPGERMRTLLQKGYYFEDKHDIDLVEVTVNKGIQPGQHAVDNIGELNKRNFFVVADDAFSIGGSEFKKRVSSSRQVLGYNGDDSTRFEQEKTNPPAFPSTVDAALGENSISGAIINIQKAPVSGVLVKLRMILPQDSIYSNEVSEVSNQITEESPGIKKIYIEDSLKHKQLQSLIAYARTDEGGNYVFKNLPNGKAFEVLPLQPGFQFGRSQGVQELNDDVTFSFHQLPHTLRLFSTRDFKILKKEKSLIVRTPKQYNQWYWIIAGSFFLGFLVLHLLFSAKFPDADQLILPMVMLMTGFSFITLLSLQDPLRDRFLAKDTLTFFGTGILCVILLMFFKLRKFTVDSGFYRMFIFKNKLSRSNGWPWACLALGLLILTNTFGTGPEGSGVKVNLYGIQPSEIVKYAIILFLAGFFSANERLISEYRSWNKRWHFFSFALVAMGVAILLYLILGDLGPAMVVCFTFIILFSFSRGDFMFMIASVVVYVLTVRFFNIWVATLITIGIITLATLFKRRQLSESAIMAIMIIGGFLLIDQIPHLDKLIPGPVQRLTERKSIWQDPWNNEVYGGDQVANGIWAMAGGGVTGQGIGEGYAKTIPEAHTDMILPAIGEEFGLAGIAGIFIIFLVFLNRSIVIGRQTGTPFLFYVCSGIGISMFVQFLLIAGGSTGALPLSGVALPFISYGGSSMVANFIAAGFLLAASLVLGTEVQMKYISRQQDKNLVPALIAACIGVGLLTFTVSRYITNNKKWVVQPSLVADRGGARMFSYNPRIAIMINKLQAGSLYDRDGRILATSDPKLIKKQKNILIDAGIDNYNIDSAQHKRLERYYPFGEQTFFWIGDDNTGVFNGSTNGYFAEYEHAAELRGFHTPVTAFNTKASHYQENRFLPRGVQEMTVVKRDYAELAPLLIAGINSVEAAAFKNRNRDVKLSLNARLQTSIQKSLAMDDSVKNSRVSVVIMEDSTGDVLTSAVYPLPPINNYDQLTMPITDQNKLAGWMTTSDLGFTYATQPGSTAKVLTAMAAFNKLGLDATKVKFTVRRDERIRTKGIEPDETGVISLERAIVKSNNVYFIKLANEQHLQEEMATLYLKTGMFLRGVGGYFYNKPHENLQQEEKWKELWRRTEFNTKPRYDPNNIHRTRAKGISGMAWGQGELIATPAAVARLASAVANKGTIVSSRFVLKVSDSVTAIKGRTQIANDPQYADLLTRYMKEQSAPKTPILGLTVAGKTGTPERMWKGERINDGWYVFFAPKANGTGHIVVCVRIESTRGSSNAVHLAGLDVIPHLIKEGYIKSFEAVE